MTSDRRKRAVFLDRDGTLNEEVGYLHRSEDFVFIPGVPEAIRLLKEAGYLVVVVTNQAGIGRGLYDEAALERLHQHLTTELVNHGTAIDASYFCPHHPLHGIGPYRTDCACRKPLPGMIHQAVADLGIDLSASWLVGDKLSDVQAGLAAGCRPVLVRTGFGASEEQHLPFGVPVCDDLLAAAQAIVSGAFDV